MDTIVYNMKDTITDQELFKYAVLALGTDSVLKQRCCTLLMTFMRIDETCTQRVYRAIMEAREMQNAV
jgi:hypothetical protein